MRDAHIPAIDRVRRRFRPTNVHLTNEVLIGLQFVRPDVHDVHLTPSKRQISAAAHRGAMHERRIHHARRIARGVLAAIGEELRVARVGAGLTQREVGAAAGLSRSEVSRIERGLVPGVAFATIVSIGLAVGLKVSLRTFPGDDPVRDAPQLAVLRRFRALVSPTIRHRTEVPLGIPGDRRAWDEVMVTEAWTMPVEAETRIGDTQALRRKLALKCRDGGVRSMVLVVNDTGHNRRAITLAAGDFAESFPISARRALAALRRGGAPPGGAIIFV